jgi:hypothetical protein
VAAACDYLRAVEDRREAMGVCAFALPGAMRGGGRVGERKNVRRHLKRGNARKNFQPLLGEKSNLVGA